MLTKTAIFALAVVGTVSAATVKPTIPRWISADKHGYGYILSSYWNGTYTYEGSTSFSWDFDYNCARQYWYSYSDYTWAEASYCNNQVTSYHSTQGCESYYAGYVSLEQETNKTINEFTVSWGSGFTDPIWGYDNYHVLEHKSDYVYLYMRPSDKAIEFIVDSSQGNGVDIVAYYPSGLSVDNATNGVWDYDLKYGYCPKNASFFAKHMGMFSPRQFAAKPTIEKPANLAAKPRAQNLNKVGGVRALFNNKNAQPKSLLSIPNKATFLINKDVVADEVPLGLFKKEGKIQSLFKGAQSLVQADDHLDKLKVFVGEFKGESLYHTLEQQVDFIFMFADTNKDGGLDRNEIRAATIADGGNIHEEELEMIMLLMDTNQDGQISKQELLAYLRAFGSVNLYYSKSEKVNMVFQYYDTNKDNFLQKSEIKRLLVDAYGYATDSDAEWFVALVDTNWDGKVSWNELYNAIQ